MNAVSVASTIHSLVSICRFCSAPLPVGHQGFRICEACSAQSEALVVAEERNAKKAELERKVEAWLAICPEQYRSTAWFQPEFAERREAGTDGKELVLGLSPACAYVAKNWRVPTSGSKLGLGLHGPPRRGKTRALFGVLQRYHFAGRKVAYFMANDLETALGDLSSYDSQLKRKAQRVIDATRTAWMLFIDDIGMQTMTDKISAAFFTLFEHRTSRRLPTLWTSNLVGDQLALMLGHRGDAIVGRLREFCHTVNTELPPPTEN
jgi:DNA replication protein DnaC